MKVTGQVVVAAGALVVSSVAAPATDPSARRVAELFDRAYEARWDTLSIGDRVGRFGRALEGSPYAEGTLEGPGEESCRVTLSGFDCVTFVETCLNLARVIEGRDPESPRPTWDDLVAAVTFTRYREGRLTGYASRLHYTAEWISDNVAKGVVEDITPALGGARCSIAVEFMSRHPERYPALRSRPAWVDSIRRIERRINAVPRTCIPRSEVAAIESRLRTGDIIAVATSIPGLDYSHTGLVYRDRGGVARFLHASSRAGRVILDRSLADYLSRGPASTTGISVLRPRAEGESNEPGVR